MILKHWKGRGVKYLFGELQKRFHRMAREAALTGWQWRRLSDKSGKQIEPKPLTYWKRRLWKRCLKASDDRMSDRDVEEVWLKVLRPNVQFIVESDLARYSRNKFREYFGVDWTVYRFEKGATSEPKVKEPLADAELAKYWCRDRSKLLDIDGIDPVMREFVETTFDVRVAESSRAAMEPISPYWFPTRPYSVRSIAEHAPWCLGLGPSPERGVRKGLRTWAQYVQAMRGIWVRPALLEPSEQESGSHSDQKGIMTCFVGSQPYTAHPRVALTNLWVDYEYWRAAASGKPRESRRRYRDLARLVRQIIQVTPRPHYAVFPELSIPRAWVHSLANTLLKEGISLIAGVEYGHAESIGKGPYGEERKRVRNSACLALTDERLGYRSSAIVWHPKGCPAPDEEHELIWKMGRSWDGQGYDDSNTRPVFSHHGFVFGVLICSELLNVRHRARYQGNVDGLFILSWNQDLNTFSSLVESAAQDVHAYTVIVNNRAYGDSRARIPAKLDYARDLCRLRGGDNDYAVVVTLDVEALRRFQSRSKPWTDGDDLFKPVPEGFKISPRRKCIPK